MKSRKILYSVKYAINLLADLPIDIVFFVFNIIVKLLVGTKIFGKWLICVDNWFDENKAFNDRIERGIEKDIE